VQNDAEVKEQNQEKISKRFAGLKNVGNNVDINRVWENIRENIKISVKVSLAKPMNGDKVGNARRESNKTFETIEWNI
jgi:hypothetical protein